jgi:hypothetical protein
MISAAREIRRCKPKDGGCKPQAQAEGVALTDGEQEQFATAVEYSHFFAR